MALDSASGGACCLVTRTGYAVHGTAPASFACFTVNWHYCVVLSSALISGRCNAVWSSAVHLVALESAYVSACCGSKKGGAVYGKILNRATHVGSSYSNAAQSAAAY